MLEVNPMLQNQIRTVQSNPRFTTYRRVMKTMPAYHQKAAKKRKEFTGKFLYKNSLFSHPFKQCPSLHSMLQLKALCFVLCLSLPLRADNIEQLELRMPQRGVCAHRGASTTHPENTISAFQEAIRLGAHMIELDVALTQDQHVILMHDSTIDRTTNGTGKVSDFSLTEIKQLDAGIHKGSKFAGTEVPTLEETLAIMPVNIWINVHLKGNANLAKATARIIHAEGRIHQCFLACGSNEIEAARSLYPEIKHCNMERQANSLQYVQETINMRAEFIQLLGGNHADPAHIETAKQQNIQINYCCTNSAEVIRKLFDVGVQFPLVDDVEGMLREAEACGIPRLKPVYR